MKMNVKGQIPPVLFLGAALIVVAIVLLAVFYLPSLNFSGFPNLSLRALLCGGATGAPSCSILDPGNWVNCVGYNLCLTVLPFLAGLILAIVVVAYVVSLFPPALGVPIVLILVAAFAFVIGFFVSAVILDFWIWLIVVGVVLYVIKKLVFKA